jgi:hypothetical protein
MMLGPAYKGDFAHLTRQLILARSFMHSQQPRLSPDAGRPAVQNRSRTTPKIAPNPRPSIKGYVTKLKTADRPVGICC